MTVRERLQALSKKWRDQQGGGWRNTALQTCADELDAVIESIPEDDLQGRVDEALRLCADPSVDDEPRFKYGYNAALTFVGRALRGEEVGTLDGPPPEENPREGATSVPESEHRCREFFIYHAMQEDAHVAIGCECKGFRAEFYGATAQHAAANAYAKHYAASLGSRSIDREAAIRRAAHAINHSECPPNCKPRCVAGVDDGAWEPEARAAVDAVLGEQTPKENDTK